MRMLHELATKHFSRYSAYHSMSSVCKFQMILTSNSWPLDNSVTHPFWSPIYDVTDSNFSRSFI